MASELISEGFYISSYIKSPRAAQQYDSYTLGYSTQVGALVFLHAGYREPANNRKRGSTKNKRFNSESHNSYCKLKLRLQTGYLHMHVIQSN